MSSDLLAEFDTFYRAPQDNGANTAPASNDLSFLIDPNGRGPENGHSVQAGTSRQWQNPPVQPTMDWGNMTSFQTNRITSVAVQDDIWGSFETSTDTGKSQAQRPAMSVYGGAPSSVDLETKTIYSKPGIVRRPTLDMFSGKIDVAGNSIPIKSNTESERLPPQRPPAVMKSSYGEVLFDADELSGEPEDDDEFGEFESVTPEPPLHTQPPQSHNAMFGATTLEPKSPKRPKNLLSTSANIKGMQPYPQAPKSPSFQERNPFTDLGLSTKTVPGLKTEVKPKSASPVTVWPTFEPKVTKPGPYEDSPAPSNQPDEDWGDFADLPPETPDQ